VLFIRNLRREIVADTSTEPVRSDQSSFALETYQSVIHRLKQQESELKELRRVESDRARTSENISAVLLANLSSGVVLFSPTQLVQQANPAARMLLGYGSPVGLHARELFRTVSSLGLHSDETKGIPSSMADVLENVISQRCTYRGLQADYTTPSGERRLLEFTLSPVGLGGNATGAACLINDLTEIRHLEQQLRGDGIPDTEMPANIARQYKASLAAIAGYARKLATEPDPRVNKELASKIVEQVESLQRETGDLHARAAEAG
jgi:PAS domain-containing protein